LRRIVILLAISVIVIFIAFPIPAKADGGPIVDPELFANLKEGQQVAVIKLDYTDTASVDLFISILDQTGESHEIVFFVPLGKNAGGFSVREKLSSTFNEQLTERLDMALFEGYRQDQRFVQSLFAGALLTNGIWLTPLWLPLFLTGCGAEGPAPISTFETNSSEVSIFGLDESTDIEALISTTGLDISVAETLNRLRGQQIAVVNLQTKPREMDSGTGSGSSTPIREPGLHLSWQTTLATTELGSTYAYPLGTGAAWSHPIEMTRIYIIAPEDISFTVKYPELGENRSGFTKKQGSYEPRIANYTHEQAYAVDTATGQRLINYPYRDLYNIWRVTYTNSNASEDILVTINESSFWSSFGASLRRAGPQLSLFIGMIIAGLFWVLTWYLLLPRLLGIDRNIKNIWHMPLIYIGLNLLLFLPGTIIYFFFSFSGEVAVALLVLVIMFGGVGILGFTLTHFNKLGVSTHKSISAFIIVTLVSSGAYLLFVWGYTNLAGVI